MTAGQEQLYRKLLSSLDAVLSRNTDKRVNGNVSSERTQQLQRSVLIGMCRRLYHLGFQVVHINNLSENHITALVQDWHRI
jgi:hypothetical protein